MKTFALSVQSPFGSVKMDDLISFVGQDLSGSFGILAGHERTMTILEYGFVTVKKRDQKFQYIGSPGGVLYFVDNTLYLITSRYFVSENYEDLNSLLQEQIAREESKLADLKESVRKMEQSMLKQLYLHERNWSVLR